MSRITSHLPLTVFSLLSIVALIAGTAHAVSPQIISFYNPETNISSYTSLKLSYDNYLSQHTSYRLQPFKDKSTFDRINADLQLPVMLITSWHYRNLSSGMRSRIRPALIATSGGRYSTSKVITTRLSTTDPGDLKGAIIASSADPEYTQAILAELLERYPQVSLDDIQILSVPKDIDALMSVSFGVADAAITYKSALDKLKKINPNLRQLLHSIASSDETLLPVLFLPTQDSPEIDKLLDTLSGMSDTKEGRQRLRLLGFDGWKKVDKKVMEELGTST